MGVMTLLARVMDTDPTAVAVGSLAGLALGVGFALMIVERFREERARGTEPHPSGMAAARTVATGGRAVLWGGTAFAMCLILAGADLAHRHPRNRWASACCCASC